MACRTMKHWAFLVALASSVRVATVQYAVPMFPGPPVVPVMVPAVAVGLPQDRVSATTTTTTTTTTVRSVAVAVPVPLPVQFPMPVYAQPNFCQATPRPAACPACPPCHCSPSCTPAFFSFCSPCHQKCRCHSPSDTPVPMPMNPPVALSVQPYPLPMPAPSPLVVVPLPPLRVVKPKTKRKPRRHSSSDTSGRTSAEDSSDFSSDDSLASSDSDYFYRKIRRKKKSHRKRRRRPARRNTGRAGDGELVKPVLTYVSQNGNIKFKRKITNAQAAQLLGGRRASAAAGRVETVQVMANEDSENRPRVVVVSNVEREAVRETGPKRIELREGASGHTLRPGRKEIVFRPPNNKRISNLSVSFQVSE